jgi:hypothetical protein
MRGEARWRVVCIRTINYLCFRALRPSGHPRTRQEELRVLYGPTQRLLVQVLLLWLAVVLAALHLVAVVQGWRP